MVAHFDNATPHIAKCTIDHLRANRLTLAPHPAFSPDLASSDFYLFGKLKCVDRCIICRRRAFDSVMEVLNGISREEPEAIYEEWPPQ
jgi:hypothetical protein